MLYMYPTLMVLEKLNTLTVVITISKVLGWSVRGGYRTKEWNKIGKRIYACNNVYEEYKNWHWK